jgi:hypothetical protein
VASVLGIETQLMMASSEYRRTGDTEMANMSYCRWNNTYQDLVDCVDDLQWWLEDNPGKTWHDYQASLSQEEQGMFGLLMKKVTEFQDTIEHYDQPEEEEEEAYEDVESWIAEGERGANEIDIAWSEMGLKSDR